MVTTLRDEAAAGRGGVGGTLDICVFCVSCCVSAKKTYDNRHGSLAGTDGPRPVLLYEARANVFGVSGSSLAAVLLVCCVGPARSFAHFLSGGRMEPGGGRPLPPSLDRGDSRFKRYLWRYLAGGGLHPLGVPCRF